MRPRLLKTAAFFVLILFIASRCLPEVYNPQSRLIIKNINFCVERPQGMGKFEPAGEEGFKIGEDAYLYMEAHNCKSVRSASHYQMYLILDMDIYYEDGTVVYSEKDVKSFSPKSTREFSKTYLWVKVETRYLKPGEYKVEVKVRDENSEKEGFTLKELMLHE